MYESPKLEKYGTFRALTLQRVSKNTVGIDTAPNWGGGLDCNSDPNAVGACRS